MNGFIYDHQPELVAWASGKIHFVPRPDAYAVGWGENGVIRAVTLYDGFSECDCNIHIASDGSRRWLRRPFLQASFMHPFVQWQLRRVTGLVPEKNTDALRFDYHLGFQFEGLVRDALPDDNIILLGMRRSECRWIPEEYRR